MKFPSVHQLWVSIKNVCFRFTLPILFAIFATICGIVLTYNLKDISTIKLFTKGIYLGNFGLTLSLSICLFAETRSLKRVKTLFANVFIWPILTLIYFTLDPYSYQSDILVLLIIGFAFHLLVAISAFTSKQENNGFWQINKAFFLRFATSALYSAVLFVGLSIALFSIQTLFEIHWNEKIYLRLWIVITGIFNTIFFLSGIKNPLKELNEDISYPNGLKIFTQYVLIPLASLYLCILLVYEAKIILEWSLPQSSVAILILGYAVFGMLSILLVHPLRNDDENKWIQWFSKSFYLLMLPLLILLGFAIFKRVLDYGITESRYLLIGLGIWLTFITLYFVQKGRDQIRMIPISLLVIALLIIFGPWGMKSVSERSQAKRLAFYLKEKPSPKRNNEVRDLVKYLYINHGLSTLQPFVKEDLKRVETHFIQKNKKDDLLKWEVKIEIKDSILTLLNIKPDYENLSNNGLDASAERSFYNDLEGEIEVNGALKIVEFNANINANDRKKITFNINKNKLEITVDSLSNLHITDSKKNEIIFTADGLLKSLLETKDLKKNNKTGMGFVIPNKIMNLKQDFLEYTIVCRFERINGGYKNNQKVYPLFYNGYLIIYPKNK